MQRPNVLPRVSRRDSRDSHEQQTAGGHGGSRGVTGAAAASGWSLSSEGGSCTGTAVTDTALPLQYYLFSTWTDLPLDWPNTVLHGHSPPAPATQRGWPSPFNMQELSGWRETVAGSRRVLSALKHGAIEGRTRPHRQVGLGKRPLRQVDLQLERYVRAGRGQLRAPVFKQLYLPI